jgi:hypothetical protein
MLRCNRAEDRVGMSTIDTMMAFGGSPGGLATIGLAVAMMLLVRKVSQAGKRRTD